MVAEGLLGGTHCSEQVLRDVPNFIQKHMNIVPKGQVLFTIPKGSAAGALRDVRQFPSTLWAAILSLAK